MTLEDEIEKEYPHLSHEETVGILCMLVEAYQEIRNTVNFLVEQVLRGRLDAQTMAKKLSVPNRRLRELEDSFSSLTKFVNEKLYPTKRNKGYLYK